MNLTGGIVLYAVLWFLVLFVLALRGLGAARTGAYFSTAPFIGAAVALALWAAVAWKLVQHAFALVG